MAADDLVDRLATLAVTIRRFRDTGAAHSRSLRSYM
jgi:hypothetical protein